MKMACNGRMLTCSRLVTPAVWTSSVVTSRQNKNAKPEISQRAAKATQARSKRAPSSLQYRSHRARPRQGQSRRQSADLAVARGVEALRLERGVGGDGDKRRRKAVAALEPRFLA